jgi:hypothetical protein
MMIKNKLTFVLFLFVGTFIVYANDKNIPELGSELNYKNVKFIKKDTFEKVKKLFIDKGFSGNFKYMDLKKNSYYRKKYLEVLKREKSYIDGNREEKLDEDVSKNRRDLGYCFFDMNGDDIPELIADNTPYSVEVFTFEKKSQKVKKLTSFISGTEFLGDNKIYMMYSGVGDYEHYLSIDDKEKNISESIFYSGSYPNENNEEKDKMLYTVGCGNASKQFEQLKNISKENNETIYYNQRRGVYCFRITEEQSNELMEPYIKIREKAKENIKKVTYTYNKLFEEFEKPKKVISDISNWKHPTKDVFEKYGIMLSRVEIIENYPIFYTKFKKKKSDNEMKKILEELLKANGYWDFEIKDEFSKERIKIFGDRENKKMDRYEYK